MDSSDEFKSGLTLVDLFVAIHNQCDELQTVNRDKYRGRSQSKSDDPVFQLVVDIQ